MSYIIVANSGQLLVIVAAVHLVLLSVLLVHPSSLQGLLIHVELQVLLSHRQLNVRRRVLSYDIHRRRPTLQGKISFLHGALVVEVSLSDILVKAAPNILSFWLELVGLQVEELLQSNIVNINIKIKINKQI